MTIPDAIAALKAASKAHDEAQANHAHAQHELRHAQAMMNDSHAVLCMAATAYKEARDALTMAAIADGAE
jgi:hypothetical protein